MVLSGTLTDGSLAWGSRTLTAKVGGQPCSGAGLIVPAFQTSFSGLSLAASCGSGAVTLFDNGQAIGLYNPATASTCLRFAPGSTASGLSVSIYYPPSSSCATALASGVTALLPALPGSRTRVLATE
jgi:hypothetical protein